MLVLCLDKKIRFLLKGLGGGGDGVGSRAGMGLINYDGIDCEFFPLYFASIVPICMYVL